MSLIHLLVLVVIIALFFWGMREIAAVFALPPQITVLLHVFFVVVVVLWLLSALGLVSVPSGFLRVT